MSGAAKKSCFQADYGIFYAGKVVKESQPGRNLNYWALWAGYKFQGECDGRMAGIVETQVLRSVAG
jgi:hypothetical protein